MQQPHFFEQRATPRRAAARVRVLYFSKGLPRAVDAECENISAEGLFVKTRRRGPEKGTPVSLILKLEGRDDEIMLEGVVRWQGGVRSLSDGSEGAGMGIQFSEVPEATRELLEHTLGDLPAAD